MTEINHPVLPCCRFDSVSREASPLFGRQPSAGPRRRQRRRTVELALVAAGFRKLTLTVCSYKRDCGFVALQQHTDVNPSPEDALT